jgi:hypothetical protein
MDVGTGPDRSAHHGRRSTRASLRLPADTALDVTPRTLYRHHEQIRAHLQVRSWGPEARRAAIAASFHHANLIQSEAGPSRVRSGA